MPATLLPAHELTLKSQNIEPLKQFHHAPPANCAPPKENCLRAIDLVKSMALCIPILYI